MGKDKEKSNFTVDKVNTTCIYSSYMMRKALYICGPPPQNIPHQSNHEKNIKVLKNEGHSTK